MIGWFLYSEEFNIATIDESISQSEWIGSQTLTCMLHYCTLLHILHFSICLQEQMDVRKAEAQGSEQARVRQ